MEIEIIEVTYSDGTTGQQVIITDSVGFTTMSLAEYEKEHPSE